MSEARKSDQGPVVPRRSLAAPGASTEAPAAATRQPLSERVSAAISQPTKTAPAAPKSRSTKKPAAAPAAAPAPAAAATQQPAGQAQPPQRQAAASRARPAARQRRARLRLVHVEPWSVMKTAFLLAVALGVVTVVAVSIVWAVLNIAGVWESINKMVTDVVGNDSGSTFDIRDYLGTSRVLGFTMLVAVFDVILITAIATLGAFLYNLAASLLGGLEVTFVEDDH